MARFVESILQRLTGKALVRPQRRHRTLCCEALEPRDLQAADLWLHNIRLLSPSEAYRSDTSAPTFTNIPAGALPVVRVDFQALDVPAGAQYVIHYDIDGRTWESAQLSIGGGNLLLFGWHASPGLAGLSAGTHRLTVKVDALNALAESDEGNNQLTLQFTVGGGYLAEFNGESQLVVPLAGIPYQDWKIHNYVDHDPTSKTRDYRGGQWTYDGHDGTDFTINSFVHQDVGVPVYAVASGVVISVHDGHEDRNITREEGKKVNEVTIDHGNGWQTQYGHLRLDSVAVSVGDVIRAGDVVGLVGSSGESSESHLHFNLRWNGLVVDPFLDQYFPTFIPYSTTAFHVIGSGVADHVPLSSTPLGNEWKNLPDDLQVFATTQTPVFWARTWGANPNDLMTFRVTRPDGSVFSTTATVGNNVDRLWDLPIATNGRTGSYKVEMIRSNWANLAQQIVSTKTFQVTSSTSAQMGKVQFYANRYYAVENTRSDGSPGEAIVTLVRSGNFGTLEIPWVATPNSATLDKDYALASGTALFRPGQSRTTIRIPLVDDMLHASWEAFRLDLPPSVLSYGRLGSRTAAWVHIIDNDQPVKSDLSLLAGVWAAGETLDDQLVWRELTTALAVTVNERKYVVPNRLMSTVNWITTFGGSDDILIIDAARDLFVAAGDGDDTISLGSGVLDYLVGAITIDGGDGHDTLLLDDRNTTPLWGEIEVQVGFSINSSQIARSSNQSPNTMWVTYEEAEDIVLRTGLASDTVALDPSAPVLLELQSLGGSDLLDYSAYDTPVFVDLAAGTATGTKSLAGFEHVVGGWGDDVLLGDAGDNLLVGGGGRNLLVGSWGSDTLIGGSDEDLLIGGVLLFDPDYYESAIQGLFAEWTRRDTSHGTGEEWSYQERVDHLTGATADGLNGPALLDPTTVLDDEAVDLVMGAEGLDWLLAGGDDAVDLEDGEFQQ